MFGNVLAIPSLILCIFVGDPKSEERWNGRMTERRKITPNPNRRNGEKSPQILKTKQNKKDGHKYIKTSSNQRLVKCVRSFHLEQ